MDSANFRELKQWKFFYDRFKFWGTGFVSILRLKVRLICTQLCPICFKPEDGADHGSKTRCCIDFLLLHLTREYGQSSKCKIIPNMIHHCQNLIYRNVIPFSDRNSTLYSSSTRCNWWWRTDRRIQWHFSYNDWWVVSTNYIHFQAWRFLYVTQGLTLKNSTLWSHGICVFCKDLGTNSKFCRAQH
jgi:hypothetical protein